MKYFIALMGCIGLMVVSSTFAAEKRPTRLPPKKKIVYRKHTQVDFTGESVQGKIRAPEVFYIFQRRRTGGHQAAEPPSSLGYRQTESIQTLKKALEGP